MSLDPKSSQMETLDLQRPEPRKRTLMLITAAIAAAVCVLVLTGGAVWASRSMLAGATITPSPAPTPTPVSGQPPPGWNLVFDEKFDDNTNHWPPIDSDEAGHKVRASIEDGAFRWALSSNGWLYRKNQPRTNLIVSDAFITVDAQVIGSRPDDNVTYGILFRVANADNYYSLQVNDMGNFWVQAHANDSRWIVCAGSSPLVRSQKVNTLGLLAVGPHMTVYINGQQVGEGDDQSFGSGRVGLLAFLSQAGYDATIVFDNMKVYTP